MGGRVLELETDRITQQGIRAWIQRGSKQTARKIVDVLLEDGRMPIEKIGKVTGVSLESIIKLDLERRECTPNCKAVAGRWKIVCRRNIRSYRAESGKG